MGKWLEITTHPLKSGFLEFQRDVESKFKLTTTHRNFWSCWVPMNNPPPREEPPVVGKIFAANACATAGQWLKAQGFATDGLVAGRQKYPGSPWPPCFIDWFPNHHFFSRGLPLSKRNHHFKRWWLTSRGCCWYRASKQAIGWIQSSTPQMQKLGIYFFSHNRRSGKLHKIAIFER